MASDLPRAIPVENRQRFEYKAVAVSDIKKIKNEADTARFEVMLNDYAKHGWRCIAVVSSDRVPMTILGPSLKGTKNELIAIFERPYAG